MPADLRSARDDVTRMLATLRERQEAVFSAAGASDFRALGQACMLIGWLRGDLEALYRALPDDAAAALREPGCTCDPFVQHSTECYLWGRVRASNAAIEAREAFAVKDEPPAAPPERHGGHIHLACDVCGSAHYPPRCERPVAPEPAAPPEPAGPTDIGNELSKRPVGAFPIGLPPSCDLGYGWNVNRSGRPDLFWLRAEGRLTAPILAEHIGKLARFAGLHVLDRTAGAYGVLVAQAAKDAQRADAAEARAAQAERERDAAREAARIAAWSATKTPMPEAAGPARALDDAATCTCAPPYEEHHPGCPVRALDERAEAKP